MKHFRMLLVMVLVLGFFLPAMATGTPVIGKLHVEKGALIAIMVPLGPGQVQMIPGIAFEDQVFYVNVKKEMEGGEVFYIGDVTGFVHDCPEHGREVLDIPIFFALGDGMIDADGKGTNGNKIRLELF